MPTKNNIESAHASHDIVNELKSLASEAENMMAGSGDKPTDALHSLQERFRMVQERFSSTCETAKKNVVAGARATDEAIRANPYQSLVIAAGVGLLVGVLLGRNSK